MFNLVWHFLLFDYLIFVCLCIWHRQKKKGLCSISACEKRSLGWCNHTFVCLSSLIEKFNIEVLYLSILTLIIMICFMAMINEYWVRWKMNEAIFDSMYWDIIWNDAYIETITDLNRMCESGGGVSFCSSHFFDQFIVHLTSSVFHLIVL